MPEIWLRYGTTDVVLDIRFENLASQVSSNFGLMQEEDVRAAMGTIPLTDSMLVLVLSPSKMAGKIVKMLVEAANAVGFSNTAVDVPAKFAGALRASLATPDPDSQSAPISINRIEYHLLEERMKKFKSTIIVSQVAIDPLFGFAGAPSTLLRTLYADRMSEAFRARRTNLPAPGEEGEPLKIATSTVEGLRAMSIELVANSKGIAGVHFGGVVEAFAKAISQMKSTIVVEIDPTRSAIISASGDPGIHSTLTGSLNSLWNSIHMVKEGGSAVLLAENRQGIGGGALQAFVEGRLTREQVEQAPYVDGLEHLLYIEELGKKYELGLISSVPQYYAKTKLGFSTYEGVRDALEKILAKHGKGHKCLVISDADNTMLKAKV